MTLQLDKRQRAMLREMGVRVWQPTQQAAALAETLDAALAGAALEAVPAAAKPLSTPPRPVRVASPISAPERAASPLRQPAAPMAHTAPASPNSSELSSTSGWLFGQTQTLYAASAKPKGARWLVLIETNAAALDASAAGSFNPFEGDAGKLLDNMLRAAGLHQAASAQLLALARDSDGATSSAALQTELAPLLAQAQPGLVLVMGRLLAQALLPSGQAFGRLRGQPHNLQDRPLVVTQEAAYLLRKPEEKDRAWEDLCLAMQLAAGTAPL
jgi:DNA polymerase